MIEIPKAAEESFRLRWNQWRQDEVTKEFMSHLAEQVNKKAKMWADGQLNGSDMHSFLIEHASAQGSVVVMQDIINLEFSDLYQIQEQEDGEQQQERDSSNRRSSPYLPGGN